MKLSIALRVLVLAGPLTACGTMMTAPSKHFLTDSVESASNIRVGPELRRTTVTIDPARARIGEVAWLVEPSAELTSDEQRQLVELLGAQLRSSLQGLPPAPSGRPVVVRAAITRVVPVSPALNTISTLLLVAPWDRGSAAMEIEAVDAETGKQFAAIRMGYFAPMSNLKARFSKLVPAEIAIRKTVTDFSMLLTPAEPMARAAAP
jgi:hypothetical protein